MKKSAEDLSERKKQIIRYISDFRQQHTFAPTVREIAEGVNLSSTSTVQRHINWLVGKGYIELEPSKPRTIRLTEKATAMTS